MRGSNPNGIPNLELKLADSALQCLSFNNKSYENPGDTGRNEKFHEMPFVYSCCNIRRRRFAVPGPGPGLSEDEVSGVSPEKFAAEFVHGAVNGCCGEGCVGQASAGGVPVPALIAAVR